MTAVTITASRCVFKPRYYDKPEESVRSRPIKITMPMSPHQDLARIQRECRNGVDLHAAVEECAGRAKPFGLSYYVSIFPARGSRKFAGFDKHARDASRDYVVEIAKDREHEAQLLAALEQPLLQAEAVRP